MVSVSMKGFTTFDRNVFKTRWKRINESPMKKAGLFVRKTAIRSIRKIPKLTKKGKPTKPSKPGKPPRSRGSGDPLRKIFSVTTSLGTRTIVGPVGFTAKGKGGDTTTVPELHEKGGRARRGILKTITGGEKRGKGRKRRTKFVFQTVRYRKRPFMVPALEKTAPKFPALWRNTVKR